MKWKRPLAMAGVIFILAMYVIAIVSAFSKSTSAKRWLMAALFSTVVIPVILYDFQLVYMLLNPEGKDRDNE